MSATPDSLLRQALRLTERMLAHARDAAWDELAQLERQRGGMLESCFTRHTRFQDRDLATRNIRKLLEMDRAILAQGKARRAQLATELDRLQHGRHANRAYANTRRLTGGDTLVAIQ